MEDSNSPLRFIATCSKISLQSYELARLNAAANLRKELFHLADRWIEAEVESRLARWALEHRRTDGRTPFEDFVALESGGPEPAEEKSLPEPPRRRRLSAKDAPASRSRALPSASRALPAKAKTRVEDPYFPVDANTSRKSADRNSTNGVSTCVAPQPRLVGSGAIIQRRACRDAQDTNASRAALRLQDGPALSCATGARDRRLVDEITRDASRMELIALPKPRPGAVRFALFNRRSSII
jgi:hypothetical protein